METTRDHHHGGGDIKLALIFFALLLFLISKPAGAASFQYEYTYFSSFFSGTGSNTVIAPDGSVQVATGMFDGFIDATIDSPVLLSGVHALPVDATIALDFYALGPGRTPELVQTLRYSSANHVDEEATFSIGAVSAAGLPMEWSIAIGSFPAMPVQGQFSGAIFTSTHIDGVLINFEGTGSDNGAIINSPGIWNVRIVPAVPEADAYLMLLSGLGLLVAVQRRRLS